MSISKSSYAALASSGAVFAIGLIFWINENSQSAQAQIAAATFTGMLAILASMAAIHAGRSLKASQEAAMNSLVPVVKTGKMGRSGITAWTVDIRNIGNGPALNIKCWVSYETGLNSDHKQTSVQTHGSLGADNVKASINWTISATVPTEYTVHIEYEDVFRRTFSSRFELVGGEERLSWGRSGK